MEIQLILIAFIVNFEIALQIPYKNDEKFQSVFDSIIKNGTNEKVEADLRFLKQDNRKKQDAFTAMKNELLQAHNYRNKIRFYRRSGNGIQFFKRQVLGDQPDAASNVSQSAVSKQSQQGDGSMSTKQSPNNNTQSKYTIVMVRHGESEWNLKNLFCGWYDADLSAKGVEEAKRAGVALKKGGYKFDTAHTSLLTRAQRTLDLILQELEQSSIPVYKTWRLNERHYGALTGFNKAETAKKHGEDQVRIWRRSYDIPPPPMEESHQYYKAIVDDPRYKDEPKPGEFPHFESLKLTIERTLPYWNEVIVPQIKEGKRILIAAHGNSLRGIVKYLDNLSEKNIMTLNLPTGVPFVYELDDNLKPVTSLKFLGDEETVAKAMAAVAAQGRAT